MAKLYVSKKFNPILYNLERCKLTKNDLCKMLGISRLTLKAYIENPDKITLTQLYVMSGMFGISPESLIYLLIRNKPQVKESDKWYIETQIKKANDLM